MEIIRELNWHDSIGDRMTKAFEAFSGTKIKLAPMGATSHPSNSFQITEFIDSAINFDSLLSNLSTQLLHYHLFNLYVSINTTTKFYNGNQ